MTIELYSGPPGGGKSFHMIAKGLETRKPIVANFPIKNPPKRWHYIEHPSVAQLVELAMTWPRRESQALLLIDEASRYFNSRAWQRTYAESMEWVTFFAEHRKLGYDVILAAQDVIMLDKQIRVNIEIQRRHLRANRIFPFKAVPWPIFFVITSWYAMPQMRKHPALMFYRPWIGSRYDTLKRFHVESSLLTARQRGEGAPVAVSGSRHRNSKAPRSVTPDTSDGGIVGPDGRPISLGGEGPAVAPSARAQRAADSSVTAGGVRPLPQEWTHEEKILAWNRLQELRNSPDPASIVRLPRRGTLP